MAEDVKNDFISSVIFMLWGCILIGEAMGNEVVLYLELEAESPLSTSDRRRFLGGIFHRILLSCPAKT